MTGLIDFIPKNLTSFGFKCQTDSNFEITTKTNFEFFLVVFLHR